MPKEEEQEDSCSEWQESIEADIRTIKALQEEEKVAVDNLFQRVSKVEQKQKEQELLNKELKLQTKSSRWRSRS
eukprot:7469721-Karenia_brevis.AAC.1